MENLTIIQAIELIKSKKMSILELTQYYFKQIEKNKDLNSYISINEKALDRAKELDKNFDKSDKSKLYGIPLSIKDIYSTKGIKTTAASNILKNYTPVYESTVTSRLLNQNALVIGKTNLDSFCHGSSTATSDFGPALNPFDKTKVSGGSSGGSAAAVASDQCVASLGTETAGSIRQPSSWCNTVGLKPTYGRVPRYGVLAMGSSLDSPGPITKTVEDAAYLLSIIAGWDENDFTSSRKNTSDYYTNLNPKRIKGIKLGIPNQFMQLQLQPEVRKNFEQAIENFKKLGAVIKYIDILDPKYAMNVYTITCRSEVSSNLSRYDGTRYCVPGDRQKYVSEYFEDTRGKGFNQEPKRRIMTGTFSLSSGYSDEYYIQSEKVRNLISQDLKNKFNEVDLIFGPTTPTTALTVDDALNNPLFGEMADILAENSSLSGSPAISIPNGFIDKLPIGIQLIGRHFDEQLVLDVALAYQNLISGK